MKNKPKELDVDFIQSKPLTEAEQKALSEYIKKAKEEKAKAEDKKAA